jgi:hypothetical protein
MRAFPLSLPGRTSPEAVRCRHMNPKRELSQQASRDFDLDSLCSMVSGMETRPTDRSSLGFLRSYRNNSDLLVLTGEMPASFSVHSSTILR